MRHLPLLLLGWLLGCSSSGTPSPDEITCDLDETLFDAPMKGDHYRLHLRGVVGVTDMLAVEGESVAVVNGQPIDLFGRAASDTVKEVLRQLPQGATWSDDGETLQVQTVGTGIVLDDLATIRVYRATTEVERSVLERLRDGEAPRQPLAATTIHEVDLSLDGLRELRSRPVAVSLPGGEISVQASPTSRWEDGDPLDLVLVAVTAPPSVRIVTGEAGQAVDCADIPPRDCTGTAAWCAEVVPFDPPTGPGYDDVPLNGETRQSPTRSHLRRDVAQLIRHVAVRVHCDTRDWEGGNGAPLILGDMSGPDGAPPGPVNGRMLHPAGTHEGGRDLDVGYYQTAFFPNNFMREVCPHHEDGRDVRHCTGSPTSLDTRRTAYFVSLLSEDPRLRCIGADAEVVGPIGRAQLELMAEGVITLEQFSGTKLCHEAEDGGQGWYRSHHTHMHVATR